jgi:hypothetical protein
MTYFEDLTPYSYSDWPEAMLNVGWLGQGHQFGIGEVDPKLRSGLISLAAHPVNMMRGLHNCQFCDVESPIAIDSPGASAFLGSGEIHVRSESGVVYAAPTLIVHYVMTHGYRPPQPFVDAVIAALQHD